MLTFEKIQLLSADLGRPNNIPDIVQPTNPVWFDFDESVSEEERKNVGLGIINSCLPYKIQDLYDRNLKMREYTAAVLENEYLKATFLPELGGRLWSLYDKKSKRDVIYKNDALIFGNLALCNAWFAGGVEWNIGVRGHSFFTCSPLFARKVLSKSSEEILRMYEYEQIRGLIYIIEATLDEEKLLVSITAKNTRSEPTYMYWWSNIAAEQTENTRFFVPSERSFVTAYRDGGYIISKIDLPIADGVDLTRPTAAKCAIDYFVDIPEKNKKWISSLGSDGYGLLEYSSSTLIGRKAFMWGGLPGGRHWNERLTCGRDYYEIQAGLSKTQFEHFPIGPGEETHFFEAYTAINLGTNQGEYKDICSTIDALVPEEVDFSEKFDEDHSEPITVFGSGRGYLYERLLGEVFHEKCEFTKKSIKETEKYYLDLLDGVEASGNDETSFVMGAAFRELIEKKGNLTPFDKYILGIICYREGQIEDSRRYLEESALADEKYYSLMAVALLLNNVYGERNAALEYARRAVDICPMEITVWKKYGEIAIGCGAFSELVERFEAADACIRENGRIKMYVGRCLVEIGEYERAKEYINEELSLIDFREGEYSISYIWTMLYKKEMAHISGRPEEEISDSEVLEEHPLPYKIDFRMH